MNELLIDLSKIIFGAILGGLFVYFLEAHRTKKQKKIIEDKTEFKIITADIVKKIMPGCTIEKMKSMLGEELIYRNEDFPIFKDYDSNNTSSYIYVLKDVVLKITSKDKINIDSLTIKLKYKSKQKIDLSSIFLDVIKVILGKSLITNHILDLIQSHVDICTMKDKSAALQFNIPNPLYKSFSLFVMDGDKLSEYYKSKDIKQLIGTRIMGVCISQMNQDAYYIYDNELGDYLI